MAGEHDFETQPQSWEQSPASRSLPQVLWQRKGLVFFGAILGLVGGFLFYLQQPPVFQSGAQLLVVKKRADALPILNGDPRLSYIEDYMSTHLVLLRSPLIIDQAVTKGKLNTLKSFESQGNAGGAVLAGLIVGRDTKEASGGANNIVNLSYRGPVAEDTGKVLSAVIDSYQDFLDTTYRNVSDQTFDLITRARDFLKTDLKKSEDDYRKFRAQSPIYWKSKDGASMQQERGVEIEKRRSQLLIRQAELRDRIKGLERAMKDGQAREFLMVVDETDAKLTGVERTMENQLLPLLLEEQRLVEEYGPKYPQLESVRKRIKLTREFIKSSAEKWSAALGDGADPATRQLNVLIQAERDCAASLHSLTQLSEIVRNECRELANYETEDDRLRGDIVRIQQLYDETIKRLATINLVRDAGGFDARLLSKPGIGFKVGPNPFQTIVGGLMLGLLVGVGLGYLAELADKSFRNPEEVRREMGYPLIGHIPYLRPGADALATDLDPLLCCLHRPKSLEAEAYRAVRTSLYFSTHGDGHKIVQITSPSKSDGKSILAANLSVSIAHSGKRVLLIDADLRRPRQHKVFGIKSPLGLTSLLTGSAALTQAVHEDVVAGLSVLPAGPVPPNPSELLTSPQLSELLESFREHYDFVIVDTPPLLAVTDPCVVASRVDGMVLVMRLARQGRPRARRAREILDSVGANVLGLVVNGVGSQAARGIYSADSYDYTESYVEDSAEDDDGYYYAEDAAEENGRAPAACRLEKVVVKSAAPAVEVERSPEVNRAGVLTWLRSFWS